METTTKETNGFVKASKKERKVLGEIFNKCPKIANVEYSDEAGNDRWDFKFTLNSGKEYIGDIKCRNVKHNKYPDVLIEAKKVKWLVEEAKKTSKVPILICHYTDKIALIWNLTKVPTEYTSQMKYCPLTTAGNRRYVQKEVYYLKIEGAKQIDLNQIEKPDTKTDKNNGEKR